MMVSLVASEGGVQCEPVLDVPHMHMTYNLLYLCHGMTTPLSIPYE